MSDPWNLERFVAAQDPVWDAVLDELRAGDKRTHWMWFVFPQLAGLGRSATARRFALSGEEEARAYLAHPTLGARLEGATAAMLGLDDERTLRAVLGTPDDMKFRSSMTLFAEIAEDAARYRRALARFCDGAPDERTLALLRG